jgi:hypothetical protein
LLIRTASFKRASAFGATPTNAAALVPTASMARAPDGASSM